MESMCNQLRSEMDDIIQASYQEAVAAQDETAAAELARKIRNKLLSDSDAEFAFDRFGLEIPENITATSMLTVLKNVFGTFRQMVSGDWAVYRQALRDITTQPGFPFDITFPVKPESTNTNDNNE